MSSALPQAELDAMSIVLLGAFNPRIFHPMWLASRGLVSDGDADTARINIITNNLSSFSLDWCGVEVLENRFLVRSQTVENVDTVRDLVLGIFRAIPYTPVERMGFNRECHFRLPSEEIWHNFGHQLAPKFKLWEPIIRNPGTANLTVLGTREDGLPGHIRVVVQPSVRVENGIYIDTNDELVAPSGADASWVHEMLEKYWAPHRQNTEKIIEHLLNMALKKGVSSESG